MTFRLELDKWQIERISGLVDGLVSERYHPERPCHTKCDLSFKKEPTDSACDHPDLRDKCIRSEAILPVSAYFVSLYDDRSRVRQGNLLEQFEN